MALTVHFYFILSLPPILPALYLRLSKGTFNIFIIFLFFNYFIFFIQLQIRYQRIITKLFPFFCNEILEKENSREK